MDLRKDLEALKQASLSSLFEEADLERVFNAGKQICLKKGQILFSENSYQETMYIILSGKVEIYKRHKQIAVRGVGDLFGEMALVESKPRSATVITAVPTLLLEISKEQFQTKLSASPDVLMAIMKTLSSRARENLKIFESQDSRRVRFDDLESANKLEQHVKYLMQEAGLTTREADVARLICDGLSDKEIADKLSLSHHTVKAHLKKIYAKGRVHARAQLVSLMYK